jgi:hypothetical protein
MELNFCYCRYGHGAQKAGVISRFRPDAQL